MAVCNHTQAGTFYICHQVCFQSWTPINALYTLSREDVAPLLLVVMVEPGQEGPLRPGVDVTGQGVHPTDLLLQGGGANGP